MQHPATYAKAVVAACAAATGTITTASQDGAITGVEWTIIVLTTLGSAAATWVVPNRDPKIEAQEQSVQPPTAAALSDPYVGKHRDDDPDAQAQYGRGGYVNGQ